VQNKEVFMMKSALMGMVLAIVLIVVPVSVKAVDLNGAVTPDFSLNGDLLYLFDGEIVSGGIGLNLASMFDGLIELRAEFVPVKEKYGSDRAGAGVGLNVQKAVERLGGQWIANPIVPSIGVLGLLNLNGTTRLEGAIYLSVLQVKF